MKALIFAAGLGSRLRPLTDTTPKALLPVGGITMLERVIVRLKEAGVDDLTINIHHLGSQIKEFLRANDGFGLPIHVSDETDHLLDTGGGLLHARPWLDGREPFFLHNADILTDVDLSALYRQHINSKAEATLFVDRRTTSRLLLMDHDMRLRGWVNKQTGQLRPDGFSPIATPVDEYAFGGIHVVSPTLFGRMERDGWKGVFSIIPFYLSVCHDLDIRGCLLPHSYWFDAGKPSTLTEADAKLKVKSE